MKSILILLALVPLFTNAVQYDKAGDFLIGAILPLTKDSGSGKCTKANPEGVALAEAINEALVRIGSDTQFTSLLSTKTLGYAIRDSCGDPIKEREIAYKFNDIALTYAKNKSAEKPVDIVISSFDKESIKALHLLNIENIPQISYSKNNAKLMQDSTVDAIAIENLISTYPENTMKINAIVDIIQEFAFQYIYAVLSDDYQGKKAMNVLDSELTKNAKCQSSYLANDGNIATVVANLKKNPLIKVVAVHCNKDMELKLYEQMKSEKMNDFIILTTQDWSKDESSLTPYKSVVDGMIYLQQEKDIRNFKNHLQGLLRPYKNRGWVKALYTSFGGTGGCLGATDRKPENEACFKAEKDVIAELSKAAEMSVYALDAVYTIAHGLLKGSNLVEAVKGLNFKIPLLPMNQITYTSYLTVEANMFRLQNVQKDRTVWVGSWEKQPNKRALTPLKQQFKWKNGSAETPVSACSNTCALGYKRKFQDANSKCCWICEKCPNGTFSNITNSDQCLTCGEGCVPNPDQTGFVYYKLKHFKWFGPLGSFIIFLIVVACCFVLLALGIISQNSDHELVQLSGYNILCLYLIGCLLLCLAPLPLLVTPTVESCSGYIGLFNLALTILFAVLMARSGIVNSYYDENTDEVIKGGLGKFPRLVVVSVVLLVQVILMIAGLSIDPPLTMHNDTENWDLKYWECSNWASYVFWIGFGYNITLSVIGNFLSCSSTKMDDVCGELKWILITYLVFYINALVEIIIFYRVVDESLAVGQAVMCIIMAMTFYFFFIWPKVFVILFRSKKDGKSLRHRQKLLSQDDDNGVMTTAMHQSDGYRHHGVVQMRIKQVDGSSSA